METIRARVKAGYNTIASNPWLRLYSRSCPKVEGTHPDDFDDSNVNLRFSSQDLRQSERRKIKIKGKIDEADESAFTAVADPCNRNAFLKNLKILKS